MGKRIGDNIALGPLHDPVISDSACRVEAFLDVSCLKDLTVLVGLMSPYAGKAVGLEFHPHGELVSFRRANTGLKFLYLSGDAQQGLHMVSYLVGYDVGLSKVS